MVKRDVTLVQLYMHLDQTRADIDEQITYQDTPSADHGLIDLSRDSLVDSLFHQMYRWEWAIRKTRTLYAQV